MGISQKNEQSQSLNREHKENTIKLVYRRIHGKRTFARPCVEITP